MHRAGPAGLETLCNGTEAYFAGAPMSDLGAFHTTASTIDHFGCDAFCPILDLPFFGRFGPQFVIAVNISNAGFTGLAVQSAAGYKFFHCDILFKNTVFTLMMPVTREYADVKNNQQLFCR
jgi:hypothetical protein